MNDLSRFRQLFQIRLLRIAALAALGAPLSIVACGGKVVVDASNGAGGSGGSGGGSGGVPTTTSSSSSSSSSSSGQPNISKCFSWGDNQGACPSLNDSYMYLGLTCDETVVAGPMQGPGECCYEVASSPDGCAVGRPFVVEDRLLAAPARRGAGESWSALATTPAIEALSLEQRAILAEAWLKDALLEHASVASFGRFALELLAFGAPADLLRAAHEAAIDEVRHAQRCFALAGAYRGEAVAPGAFPFGGAVVLAADLAALAESAVIEGCIGETLAALL
ncbi:MAG: ferritin-like domain-containing protein, partial [Minicystis sp.]